MALSVLAKERHRVASHMRGRKAAYAGSAFAWRNERFQEIVKSFSSDEVFNAYEAACFYNLSPHKRMNSKCEKREDGKKSRVCVSVLFCWNDTGMEKLEPLVIG